MAGRRNDEEPRTTPTPTVTDGYLASGTFLGNYHILKKIGEGGMGVVYAAEHPMHGRVAVKLLSDRLSSDEEFKKRFIREVKLMQRISHPNIVRYVGADFDIASKQMYLVTEYVKGLELEQIIRRMGSIPCGHVVGISSQICDALSVIHEAGIVHRDLKPGNIMLLDDKTAESGYLAKVLDLGIARLSKDVQQRQSMNFTRLGGVIGTPEYLSPEQAKGEELDHRSDIYSLGIIMYEMLTGKVPFEADTPEKVAIMHATEPPQRISEKYPNVSVPDNLEKVILSSLEKDPAKRFQSAREMKKALRNEEEASADISSAAGPSIDSSGSLSSGTHLGNYRILKMIGKGGMGVVYAAEHPIHGRVALKVLSEELSGDEEFRKRFIREINTMQSVSHRNIVKYVGADIVPAGRASGNIYLVTEYVDGMELENIIKKTGPMKWKYVRDISVQLCSALAAIHRMGIVHRDLKPANIMLLEDKAAEGGYLVKLLDFGIAKFTEEAKRKGSMRLTMAGMTVGTPEYLSPEQAKAEKIDHRSDIYSLGIIMYEMLTGKVPFEADTPAKVCIMQAVQPPPKISEKYRGLSVPEGVEAIIMRTLRKDPAERFQNVQEMQEAIRGDTYSLQEVREVVNKERVRRGMDESVGREGIERRAGVERRAVRQPPPPPPPKKVQPVPSVEVHPQYQKAMKAAGGVKLGETEYMGRDDPRHQRIVRGAAMEEKHFQRPVFDRMPKPVLEQKPKAAGIAEPFTQETYSVKNKPSSLRGYGIALLIGGVLASGGLIRHCLRTRDASTSSVGYRTPAVVAGRTETGKEKPGGQPVSPVQPLEQKLASCDFMSSPPGAAITYKGNVMGRKTPLKVQGLPYNETLDVKVELEGYETETKALPSPESLLLNGLPCAYSFTLKQIAEMVQCTFTTEPNGVEIYRVIDGNEELLGKGTLHKEFPKGKEIAFVAKAEGYKNHPHTRIIEDPCQLKFTMRRKRADLSDKVRTASESDRVRPHSPELPSYIPGLIRSQIIDGLKPIGNLVQYCANTYQENGRMIVNYSIKPDGSVGDIFPAGVFSSEFKDCIAAAFARATFPRFNGSDIRENQIYNFSRASTERGEEKERFPGELSGDEKLDKLLDDALREDKREQHEESTTRPARSEFKLDPAGLIPLPSKLSRGQIKEGMDRIEGRVRDCYAVYKEGGVANVRTTVERNGKVSSANVRGEFGDGTKKCIEEAVLKATFQGFSGEPMTFTYPFMLR